MNDPKVMVNYLYCLSFLEENVSVLYDDLSEMVELPLIKSLLVSISKDSSKHAALLKGVASSILDSKREPKDCAKKLGEVWSLVSKCLDKISGKENRKLPFSELFLMLSNLESSMGEEYYIFVQMKTLQLMVKDVNQLYNINLDGIKKVFESIIRDEEHHREILATIKEIIGDKPITSENSPKVKYHNPDAWVHSLPPTTYNSK
jgi:hypothetical protein